MWSHDIVVQSYGLANDLKTGQYLKIPPRAMFLTQIWGTILGMYDESIIFEVTFNCWYRCNSELW